MCETVSLNVQKVHSSVLVCDHAVLAINKLCNVAGSMTVAATWPPATLEDAAVFDDSQLRKLWSPLPLLDGGVRTSVSFL